MCRMLVPATLPGALARAPAVAPRAAVACQAGLPISLPTFLYAAIVAVSANDLRSQVPALLSGEPVLGSAAINVGLGGYAVYNLAKMFGVGKTDFYDTLRSEDEAVGSLAAQAAAWAQAGEVPTRSGMYEVASFAGGCFWGTELHFQRIPGVVSTCVGYTQGATAKPNYAECCSGATGHTEGLMLTFDPEVVTYDALCDKLLSTVDSTALNRVGNDMGTQYRHGIYPNSDAQAAAAKRAIEREQAKQPRPVVTEVERAAVFWPAEVYHQRYLQKGGQSAEKNAPQAVRCYG